MPLQPAAQGSSSGNGTQPAGASTAGEGPGFPALADRSEAQIAFQVGSLAVDYFEVTSYSGTEGLCQLYQFEIGLTTTATDVDPAAIVGRAAVLSINTGHGVRWFHGIVRSFRFNREVTSRTSWLAELVPVHWVLTQRHHCRIFQNKTVPEIIEDVFAKAGISSNRYSTAGLTGSYEPVEYSVQYRETDYNYIARLMEAAGIRWYFTQTQTDHVMLLEDGPASGYEPIEGDSAELPFQPLSGLFHGSRGEYVTEFSLQRDMVPGAVDLRDFNFTDPKLDLKSQSTGDVNTELEVFDFPGNFDTQQAAQNATRMAGEMFQAGRVSAGGESNSPRLMPGRTFDLAEHTGGLDGSYYVTSVSHEGKQATTAAAAPAQDAWSNLARAAEQANLTNASAFVQSLSDVFRAQHETRMQIIRGMRGLPFGSYGMFSNLASAARVLHGGRLLPDGNGVHGQVPTLGFNPRLPKSLAESVLRNLYSAESQDRYSYRCSFECIPADVTYRPPRATPTPHLTGPQTARVVGPSGEEIYTDEYGRVKVQFAWDPEGQFDENSSCWIRVSQGLAGGAYGMMFLPRVGQEVIVDFLEGNPSKPVITGRLYNADHMPPYTLPDEKTKSTIKTNSSKGGGGSNEIRFEDLKGSEQILVHAEKDYHLRAKASALETIGGARHVEVGGDDFESYKQKRNIKTSLDIIESCGGTYTLKIDGDYGVDVGGNHSTKANKIFLKAAADVVIEAPSGITLKAGGNFVKIDASGVTIVGTMVKINSGGAAGSGSPVSIQEPADVAAADENTPGRDTTYSGGQDLAAAEAIEGVSGHDWEPPEQEEEEASWVEINLVDDEGNPVPHERYRVRTPDGRIIEGSLNEDGLARVQGIEPGECEITFPNLDQLAWGR